MKGTWRDGSFTGDPKRYVKVLEMGVCFHSGPAFREHGGAQFLRAFERKNSNLEEFLCGFREICKNAL
jgi:hypothetical protein